MSLPCANDTEPIKREPHTPFTGNADPEFPDHAVPKE